MVSAEHTPINNLQPIPMKPLQVQFLFDFGSPNAYLCHKVLADIESRTGVRFEYLPILLGGLFKLSNNRSPFSTKLTSSLFLTWIGSVTLSGVTVALSTLARS